MLEGKGKNGYFKLGAVEVGMEPGTPQQMSIDFMALKAASLPPARIVGEPWEILALATKIKRMVMAAIGNPAEEFNDRTELKDILETEADSDAKYQDVIAAAKMVIATWETGNLAGCVNDLRLALKVLEGR